MAHSNLRPYLLLGAALIAVRLVLGWALWDPVQSALTWDDFTRVLIAQRWAGDPFISADLVWLPSQTWLLGSLFWLTGGIFARNPMALVAILNSLLIVGTAVVVGWAAFRISRSRTGGLLAFVVILFSPWGYYTSLAGLAEPLYYFAVAGAMATLVAYHQEHAGRHLAIGAASVAMAAATRYEGWWLAVAWTGAVLVSTWIARRAGDHPRWSVVLFWGGVPFLVPAAWLLYNVAETGSPLEFARRSSEYFAGAYGGLPTILGRLLYYPISLIRADVVLLLAVVALSWRFRRDSAVRLVAVTVSAHLALFYGASIVSGATGAFNERFMFGFLLAVAPVLGLVPRLLAEPGRRRVLVAVAAALAVVGVTAYRWTDRPVEWSHAPDLLAVLGALDDMVETEGDLHVTISPEMQAVEAVPMTAVAGPAITIDTGDEPSPDADLFISRYPASREWLANAVTFGRYQVVGRDAAALGIDTLECPCDGWTQVSETGEIIELPPGPYAWTEFEMTDPTAGSESVARTRLVPGSGRVRLEVRSLYGHGFNPGRILVQVRLDDRVIDEWDIAEPSRWRAVDFTVPSAGGDLEVAVVAQSGIETGWAWGTASTVLIRAVEDLPG